jgi:RimJ/RimL family protein N-acetyltransferase
MTNLRLLLAALLVVAAAYVPPTVACADPLTFDYKGFRIDLSAARGTMADAKMIAAVKRQVDLVEQAKLKPQVLAFMRTIPVWANPKETRTGPGHYSRRTGIDLRMPLLEPNKPILLHELLHAYHDQQLPNGFENADIRRFYERAQSAGWPKDSYMMSNHHERPRPASISMATFRGRRNRASRSGRNSRNTTNGSPTCSTAASRAEPMQPVLTTRRLTLRPLSAADRERLADVFSGAGVRQYLFDNEEVSPETLDAIMDANLRRNRDGLGLWLIEHDGAVIGCVVLHRDWPPTLQTWPAFAGETEIVIALKEEHWGQGYAREAVEAALAYASGTLGTRRIVTLVDEPNERSRKLMQRCGFRQIGSAQGPLYMNVAYELML